MIEPVLFAVIVGELLTRFNSAYCSNVDLFFLFIDLGLTIGLTGVVDITRNVAPLLAVNDPIIIKREEVFAATAVTFFGTDTFTGVLDHDRVTFDSLSGKQPETG